MVTGAGRVFCIGETVLDIIFREDQPVAARPGGSMLNTAVSLGRTGIPVYFISECANDHAGDLICRFLAQNGVSTDYLERFAGGKTALSLAFLDDQQNADYSFYKIFPEERLTAMLPAPQSGDIVLFGSFYALTGPLRPKLTDYIRNARANGAFIIYDPNFRSAHLGELETTRPWILENISLADLVRGSDEDFMNIFSSSNASEAFRAVNGAGCPLLIYTQNRGSVEAILDGHSRSYVVPQIIPVSTIGAGDAFNAGIIHALLEAGAAPAAPALAWRTLDHLVATGIRFSANVCQHLDNYISAELAHGLKSPSD